MRIALDARSIYRPNRRGTGKNLVDLYRHLAAACPHWQVMAFCRQGGPLEAILPEQVEPRPIAMIGGRFDAWVISLRTKVRLRTPFDDAHVGNIGANGLVFDPVTHPVVRYGGWWPVAKGKRSAIARATDDDQVQKTAAWPRSCF